MRRLGILLVRRSALTPYKPKMTERVCLVELVGNDDGTEVFSKLYANYEGFSYIRLTDRIAQFTRTTHTCQQIKDSMAA